MTRKSNTFCFLAIFGFCLLLIGISGVLVFFQSSIHQEWTGLLAPNHQIFSVNHSNRVSFPIGTNADQIEWLGVRWSLDSDYLKLRDSRIEKYATASVYINSRTGTYIGEVIHFAVDINGGEWILDTQLATFQSHFTARRFIIPNMDYPHQFIQANWLGNNQALVFGNSTFGIETYNMDTHQRYWLLETGLKAFTPGWSITGRWISALRYEDDYDVTLIIVSPDGKHMSFLETCGNIEEPEWSPTDDRIAFICHHYDKSACNIDSCDDDNRSLIIWGLNNTPIQRER